MFANAYLFQGVLFLDGKLLRVNENTASPNKLFMVWFCVFLICPGNANDTHLLP